MYIPKYFIKGSLTNVNVFKKTKLIKKVEETNTSKKTTFEKRNHHINIKV